MGWYNSTEEKVAEKVRKKEEGVMRQDRKDKSKEE